MKTVKILFTCIGRRVELVQAFRSAAKKLNIDLILYGADTTQNAPALQFCNTSVMVPEIKSPEYISELLKICKREKIDILIPTIDTDLLVLSINKEQFKAIGTRVLVSDEDKIRICRDKRVTAEFLLDCGLDTPVPVDDCNKYNADFPAFIKPKDGSSSINAYKINSIDDLKTISNIVPDYIIQPFINGTEYTVDAFCDFDGNPVLITPRIRLAVRAGEVLKTQIDLDDTIISEVKRILKAFKPCGQITIQLIRQSGTNKDYFIEINPRFGGGAPLSIKAGADSAEMLLRLACGESLTYKEKAAENGAVFCRFDQSVRIKTDN